MRSQGKNRSLGRRSMNADIEFTEERRSRGGSSGSPLRYKAQSSIEYEQAQMRETQFNRMDHQRKMQVLAKQREINVSRALIMEDQLNTQQKSSLLQEEKAAMKHKFFR